MTHRKSFVWSGPASNIEGFLPTTFSKHFYFHFFLKNHVSIGLGLLSWTLPLAFAFFMAIPGPISSQRAFGSARNHVHLRGWAEGGSGGSHRKRQDDADQFSLPTCGAGEWKDYHRRRRHFHHRASRLTITPWHHPSRADVVPRNRAVQFRPSWGTLRCWSMGGKLR